MKVSAISTQDTNGYKMSNSISVNSNRMDQIGETSFNSLTPYYSSTKKVSGNEKLPMVFDSVNQWKNFCHQRIVGSKLNVIA